MLLNPSIYRIDKGHHLLKEYSSAGQIVKGVVEESKKRLKKRLKVSDQSYEQLIVDDIYYHLFVFNSNEVESNWKGFLPEGLRKNQSFVQQHLSILMFANIDDQIFCVVGGLAYQMIVPFIDHSFGLQIYSRLIDPTKDTLSSIKYRGITGQKSSSKELYRNKFKIMDFVKFGKIPQEVNILLGKEASHIHFQELKTKINERIQISVGKSFKLKKKIDFEGLHELLKRLNSILDLPAKNYLSSYIEITDKKFIDDYLRQELVNEIFNDIQSVQQNSVGNRFEFEFTDPNNIEEFYEADEYEIKERIEKGKYETFDIVNDRSRIYKSVINKAIEKFGVNDRFKFMVFLQGVRVTYRKKGQKSKGSSFLYFFSTELIVKKQPYFLIDSKWYQLQGNFIEDLKNESLHVLKTYKTPDKILELKWNKEFTRREDSYNILYDKIDGYIVLDKIIVDGIELCDLLFYNDKELYIIHVKYGFTSSIRELTNQIKISAKRLKDSLGTREKKMITSVYKGLISKGRCVHDLSLQDFINLFKKNITYVLAFSSQLKEDILVEENIEKYDSNIAKFSMVECSAEMRSIYYDLLVHQIRRF